MRWSGCALVWLLLAATTLYVTSQTQWGPIVVRLSHSHGIHLGDLLVILLALFVGATVTWATARRG